MTAIRPYFLSIFINASDVKQKSVGKKISGSKYVINLTFIDRKHKRYYIKQKLIATVVETGNFLSIGNMWLPTSEEIGVDLSSTVKKKTLMNLYKLNTLI